MTLPWPSGATGWELLEAGNAAAVVESLAPAGERLPLAERTLRGLAKYDLGDDAGCEADLAAVLRSEPENPIARSHHALALARLGRRREAAEVLGGMPPFPHRGFLRRFLAQFWPDRIAHHVMDGAQAEGAPPESAMPAREPATSAQQRRCEKLAARARKLFFKEQRMEALALFREAWELDPDNGHVAENYSYLLLLLGRPEEAEAVLRPKVEAVLRDAKKNPGEGLSEHGDLLTSYAWCRHEAGAHSEALWFLSAVRPDGPEDFGSHFVAAMCWLMLGRDAEYREALDQALGPYFIDTWEQIVKPMIVETAAALRNSVQEVASVE